MGPDPAIRRLDGGEHWLSANRQNGDDKPKDCIDKTHLSRVPFDPPRALIEQAIGRSTTTESEDES